MAHCNKNKKAPAPAAMLINAALPGPVAASFLAMGRDSAFLDAGKRKPRPAVAN